MKSSTDLVLDNDTPVPKLCLNMIVKNESRIIKRLLLSVSTLIDTYCICDTGSTDNTIEIIETFFRDKQIPGKVIEEPFRDFGYNRSYALKACEIMDADYILLLDADMIFWRNPNVSPEVFKRSLSQLDLGYIYQGTETFYYKNARIVKNNHGFSYWGVTHEYVNSPPNTRDGQLDKSVCFIKDIGDGGSKSDKFLRDIALLKKGLEEHPNNDRYTFYLANSLKDAGKKEEAIASYRNRIALGGWIEEVWYSYYNIGKCYQEMGQMESAICAWMEAYEVYPNRIENLYEIIQYYRCQGKYKLAQLFYVLGDESRTKYTERDYLFFQKDVYDYKLDYEKTIFGFYHNPDEIDIGSLCMRLLAYPYIEDGIFHNILSNYKFYCRPIDTPSIRTQTLRQNGLDQLLPLLGKEKPNGFVSSTPTFCVYDNDPRRLFVNVRFVNYRINAQGGYDNQSNIETRNICAELYCDANTNKWSIQQEHLLQYNREYDNQYVGLEDIRFLSIGQKVYYTANRGLSGQKMVVEHGWIDINTVETKESKHLEFVSQRSIEKNWVMFEADSDSDSDSSHLKLVYNWYPMTIGTVEDSKFQVCQIIQTPFFFKSVRGSTNGIQIENEIWFLCHLVSYEDRRYYYHLFVMLDKTTQTIRYTRLFSFGSNAKVEYCLGMIHSKSENELWLGYSVMDRETKYMSIRIDTIRNMIMR